MISKDDYITDVTTNTYDAFEVYDGEGVWVDEEEVASIKDSIESKLSYFRLEFEQSDDATMFWFFAVPELDEEITRDMTIRQYAIYVHDDTYGYMDTSDEALEDYYNDDEVYDADGMIFAIHETERKMINELKYIQNS